MEDSGKKLNLTNSIIITSQTMPTAPTTDVVNGIKITRDPKAAKKIQGTIPKKR